MGTHWNCPDKVRDAFDPEALKIKSIPGLWQFEMLATMRALSTTAEAPFYDANLEQQSFASDTYGTTDAERVPKVPKHDVKEGQMHFVKSGRLSFGDLYILVIPAFLTTKSIRITVVAFRSFYAHSDVKLA